MMRKRLLLFFVCSLFAQEVSSITGPVVLLDSETEHAVEETSCSYSVALKTVAVVAAVVFGGYAVRRYLRAQAEAAEKKRAEKATKRSKEVAEQKEQARQKDERLEREERERRAAQEKEKQEEAARKAKEQAEQAKRQEELKKLAAAEREKRAAEQEKKEFEHKQQQELKKVSCAILLSWAKKFKRRSRRKMTLSDAYAILGLKGDNVSPYDVLLACSELQSLCNPDLLNPDGSNYVSLKASLKELFPFIVKVLNQAQRLIHTDKGWEVPSTAGGN